VAPQSKVELPLPGAALTEGAGCERFLNLSYTTTANSPFWQVGYELGWNQLTLSGSWRPDPAPKTQGEISTNVSDDSIVLSGGDSWGAIAHVPYLVTGRHDRYRFRLESIGF
jgi:hypothetical protein